MELQTIFRENLCLTVFEKWILLASFFFLSVSLVLGCCTAWNRLVDFRKTTRIDLLKWKEPENAEIEKLKKETDILRGRTWRLLCWQTKLFGLGMLLLVICAGSRVWR